MRRLLIYASVLTAIAARLAAHSGGLDQYGGHRDSRTGTYHYHRPATPAPPPPPTGVRPSITLNPQSRTVRVGELVSLSVAAAGTSPFRYQWEKDGSNLPGATANVYSVNAASQATGGQYRCLVSNSYGSAWSGMATITVSTPTVPPPPTTPPNNPTNPLPPPPVPVNPLPPVAVQPPRMVGAPQSSTVARGGSTTLTAQAVGDALQYQWYRDGVPVLGAISSAYRIDKAQDWMTGTYTVGASNPGGSVISEGAILEVGPYLIADDFIGPLNSSYWTSVTPFSDSRVTAAGVLVLRNRGRILSRVSMPQRYTITTRFRLVGSSYDQFSIYFRSNGATRNNSFDSGLSARFQIRSGDQGATGSNNIKIGTPTGEITADYPLAMNRWYDAEIEDDGQSVTVSLDGTPVVHYETTLRAGSLIGLQNREGAGGGSFISADSVTEVEYIRVTSQDSAPQPLAPQSRVANLSTRGVVGYRGEPMIVGFVTTGDRPHNLLVRAAGPALSSFGVSGVLANPSLTIRNAQGATVASNDDWSVSAVGTAAPSVGAFPFALGSRDAALVASFQPGAYTAQVSGTAGNVGVAIVEGYDLDAGVQSVRLKNLSTRGVVGVSGENLSAGLVVTGDSPRLILIRAVGPSLGLFGVADPLPDPVLTVYDSSRRVIYSSDNWGDAPHANYIAEKAEEVGAFTIPRDSKDAAVLAYVPAASYTFVISSKTGGAGTALLEAYDLDQ